MDVDARKIKAAVAAGERFEITSEASARARDERLEKALAVFLEASGAGGIAEYLECCVDELVANGKKANAKRAFFADSGLDINDGAQYERGMKSFKSALADGAAKNARTQRRLSLRVTLALRALPEEIVVEVRNNSVLTKSERERIQDKRAKISGAASLADALPDLLDGEEGAGLGLAMVAATLKKIGAAEESFQTFCENGETVSRIILPRAARP